MASPRIVIDGPLGPKEFLLQRLSGTEELGRPFQYDLFVLAGSKDISLSDLIGHIVCVHVDMGDEGKRHFSGVVTRAVALGPEGRHARFHLQLKPWLSLLEHTSNCRIFQQKTVPEVLRKVFDAYSFAEVIYGFAAEYRTWEYLVQYRESDLQFVTRLMEQEGIYYFWQHDADNKHTLVLVDDIAAHDKVPGFEKVKFSIPGTGAVTEKDFFDAWTFSEEVRPNSYALDDYDFQKASAGLFVELVKAQEQKEKKAKTEPLDTSLLAIYDYPGEYVELSEGESYVRSRLEEVRTDHARAFAQGNVRGLFAGALFGLIEHPRSEQNREYLITACEISIEEGAPTSGGGAGSMVVRCRLGVISSAVPYRLPRRTPKPQVGGPQTATVVGKKDEEIWTDEYGRVKVQFRWDREGKSDEQSSCWVRVAQVWAGSGYGAMHIPRIGQEVIVDFLEGDPDRPIITGRVYNSDQKPPYTLPANQTQSGIKSRSTKGGGPDNANEIRFEDKKGEEELFVQAERNHTVKVKKDRSVSVGGSESISVSGTRSSTITKKNTDTYKDEHEMTVTKKVTETFNDEHHTSVKLTQFVDAKDKNDHITGTYELKTDTCFQLIQDSTTMKVSGNVVEFFITSALKIERGSGKIAIDESGAISIESGTAITIKVGGNTLEITPSGISATSGGSMLTLDPAATKISATMVDVAGTASVGVTGAAVKLNA